MQDVPSIDDVRKVTRVIPGKSVKLDKFPTHGRVLFKDKDIAERSLLMDAVEIDDMQDRLYAEKSQGLLVIFQGIDTSGKDGTTKGVFSQTSPLGLRVHAFGRPSSNELARDYLWRIHNYVPRKGEISIFNRSHYEDVLVVRVHELVSLERVEERYEQINNFEEHLSQNGVKVLKIMLHISKETQGERLRDRLEDPLKRWKFNPGDLDDRAKWDEFQEAYRLVLERCSTKHSPWHVVPSDSRTRRKAIAARLVRGALEEMNPQIPDPGYRPDQFVIE